jgi:1,4-alpha-glucan branching enzyme
MTQVAPKGYLTLTLHAHLPYVVNHGTWPHGMEWLLEAATETYLPLLRVLGRLQADGIALKANLNISPILLEQLAHPVFQAELPEYLRRKIAAATVDEAQFKAAGDEHLADTARWWQGYFTRALEDFTALDSNIIAGFRRFNDAGMIDIITCAATHGYFPLLGTDESIVAQIKTGAATHRKHLGKEPRGMWAPECGYRPAGLWQTPVTPQGLEQPDAPFERMGVEEAMHQSGIGFFFADTHLIDESVSHTPYDLLHGDPLQEIGEAVEELEAGTYLKTVYKPYIVDGPAARHPGSRRQRTHVFPRDPRTGIQVWSGDTGYPGDGVYLDFHKRRWPGGHRYWQVTHSKADLGLKTPYYPERAATRTKAHAEHFASVVIETLSPNFDQEGAPPILTSPFDAELFGHWWHEGPEWLEHVARAIAREDSPVALISCAEYLDKYPPTAYLGMKEGSWGENGNNHVWLNPDTSWTWTHIYPAETTVREIATEGAWRDGLTGERILKQLCRELLLLESSDWQFLITTGPARDYAEARFRTHVEQFKAVEDAWLEFKQMGELGDATEEALKAIEVRDSIFAEVDPSLWAIASDPVESITLSPAALGD